MDLFLLHCLLLVWAGISVSRKMGLAVADQLLATALLAWGNLVLTCLLLSTVHRLGEPDWFLGVSGSLALAGVLFSRYSRPPDPADSARNGRPVTKPNRWVLGGFAVTIVPVACALMAVACTYQPNNEEAMTHDLPRVMYYLGQGTLAHFSTMDLRHVALPFNSHLLLLFSSVYGQPAVCLNCANVLAWMLAGLAAYRLCQGCGCNANSSLMATWLVLTVAPVIVQATSTTPDLLAGTALLCACLFTLRWQQTSHRRYALLAGLAAGLGAGSSLSALCLALPGLLWVAWSWRRSGRMAGYNLLRPWILPLLLAALFSLPFAFINAATTGNPLPGDWPSTSAGECTAIIVSFGFTGFLFLLGGVLGLRHPGRPGSWIPRIAAGWLLTIAALSLSRPLRIGDFVPVLLILTPWVATLIESLRTAPRGRRTAGGVILLVAALAAVWSDVSHVLDQPSRPLRPLLNGNFAPSAIPPLPVLLAERLSAQPRVNVDSDGLNERIFPLMAQDLDQRFTSRGGIDAEAYNLISRSALSRGAGGRNLDTPATCVLIPLPGKLTAGVEFLATIGRGPAARDYFGLPPRPGRTASTGTNQQVLLTLSRAPGAVENPPDAILTLIGLNPKDGVRLVVDMENPEGNFVRLATFTTDGAASLPLAGAFRQLRLKVLDTGTGREISTVFIPHEAPASVNPEPVDPGLPSSALSLFTTDLVRAGQTPSLTSEGLGPIEGPLPLANLPYVRSTKQPAVLLRLAPQPRLAGLQLSFSVRLQERKTADLDVLFNGQVVKEYHLDGPAVWLDDTLDLSPQTGENSVEFRDVSLQDKTDWMDYLERYYDVKDFLVTMNMPLRQGARDHYLRSGRAEGRTSRALTVPLSAPQSRYFVFRKIRLEGFRSP